MAADTPAPYIDAFFRFYSDGEFDDSRVVDTVVGITGSDRLAASSRGSIPRGRVQRTACAAPARSQGGASRPHQGLSTAAQLLLL